MAGIRAVALRGPCFARPPQGDGSPIIHAAAPAVLPHLLADGAGDARLPGAGGDDLGLRLAAGDFEDQLGARRLDELLALPNRHDESAGPADHAILVIDVELLDIECREIGALEHDRQADDGDAGIDALVARWRDE